MKKLFCCSIFLLVPQISEANRADCPNNSIMDQKNFNAISGILASVSSASCDVCKKSYYSSYDQSNYEFGVCESGKFKIVMNSFFPDASTAESVFNEYYLQGSKIKAASDLIVNSTATGTVDLLSQKKNYLVTTKVNKTVMGISSTSTITSNCWVSQENSTTIVCTKSESSKGVACKITVIGNTKRYWRSPKRLAVSGAIETMKNMYGLNFTEHGQCGVLSCADESKFYKNNLEPFWKKGVSAVESSVIPQNG